MRSRNIPTKLLWPSTRKQSLPKYKNRLSARVAERAPTKQCGNSITLYQHIWGFGSAIVVFLLHISCGSIQRQWMLLSGTVWFWRPLLCGAQRSWHPNQRQQCRNKVRISIKVIHLWSIDIVLDSICDAYNRQAVQASDAPVRHCHILRFDANMFRWRWQRHQPIRIDKNSLSIASWMIGPGAGEKHTMWQCACIDAEFPNTCW